VFVNYFYKKKFTFLGPEAYLAIVTKWKRNTVYALLQPHILPKRNQKVAQALKSTLYTP